MSLKAIHILFISASTVLSVGFGGWSLHHYFRVSGDRTELVMGIVSLILAAGLVVYGRYFLKKLKGTSYL